MVRRLRFEGTHGFRRYARVSTPGENRVFRKCFRVEKMKGAMREGSAARVKSGNGFHPEPANAIYFGSECTATRLDAACANLRQP